MQSFSLLFKHLLTCSNLLLGYCRLTDAFLNILANDRICATSYKYVHPWSEQKFGKRKMADSDFNFFFKNPKYPLGNPPFCLWNHQKWFWGPKIAPLSFSQKFWKNITPHVFAPSTLNFCPIFKCHTILESWRVAGFDGTKILWGKFMTNEKSALEIWLSRGL